MADIGFSRRKFMKASAAGALVSAVPATPHAAAQEPVLLYGARGGIVEDNMRATILKPFTAETRIDVKPVAYPSLAKLKAMVQTNTVDLDIFATDHRELIIAARQGLLEQIDYKQLPVNLQEDLIPGSVEKFGVGQMVFGQGIVYNSQRIPKGKHPRTWAEFWDVKRFPGPRSLPDPSFNIGPLEAALIADGVPPAQLYPLDLDRAFKMMDKIRPHIVKFWSSSAEGLNLLTSGNVDIGTMTYGRVIAIKLQGDPTPLEVEFNEGFAKIFYWVIPKGAKRPGNAYKLISYFLNPRNHGAYINGYPAYGPVSTAAAKLITPENLQHVITASHNLPNIVMLKDDWWIEQDQSGKTNFDKVLQRWKSWISS